jgi:class 3 adenylate cyclase
VTIRAETGLVIPETLYAETNDGVWVAYQTLGEGPVDLVVVHEWVSHLEVFWEQPLIAQMITSLAKGARVITFDKRGTGLSDRISKVPDLEARMDDIRAVMVSAESERATLLGLGDGAALAALFAATYPERSAGLILYGGNARMRWAPDYPWGLAEDVWIKEHKRIPEIWGREQYGREWSEMSLLLDPGEPDDPELFRWAARWARYSAAPGDMLVFDHMWAHTDVREILPSIQVPTTVVQWGDSDPGEAEYVASRIPGARLLRLPGARRVAWRSDLDELSGAVHGFLGSIQHEQAAFDRLLATVLFTDIVDSTSQSAAMGDEGWGKVQEGHDRIVRAQLARFRGREIRTMGDGFLATFDGPARAVRCAQAIIAAMPALGIEVRAGLHTGEIEFSDGDISGLAVAIGARVGAHAAAQEVLVSSTVKDLVVGSGISLRDRGTHELKGVPGGWHLFAVAPN